ncbi:MAG: hypothetical protein PHH26_00085 [Candidatus Thermoplasmatota archaeon]|nr:hypothetical protein [Candidatus Thermoplasmatota archaeon]
MPISDGSGDDILMLIVFAIFWLAISTPIAIWTYFNAKKRGMSKTSWFFAVMVGGIIGLAFYISARKDCQIKTDAPLEMEAQEIQNETETVKEIAKCPECGTELEIEYSSPDSKPFKCPNCGAELKLTSASS